MKLSIIIPTLGRETLETVLEAIERCDDYNRIRPEVIIVFSGEKNVREINEDHFKIFKTKTMGAGPARNLGMEKSTGEIIAFLGDDTIPAKDWLQKVYMFHTTHTSQKEALLGKVSWTPDLAKDPFHKWLENNAQFAFKSIARKGANWRHFYTSNISVKRALVSGICFSNKFKGWGFEDTEFGYRLAKRGMRLHYDSECEVFHDHEQNLEDVLAQTKNAKKNALIFEKLHPEVQLISHGAKKFVLKILIILSYLYESKQMNWWRKWKRVWLDS